MTKVKGVLKVATNFAVLSVLIVLIYNRQSVYDWYALRGYKPDQNIKQLADKSSMSSRAEKLFYVHKPSLLEKEEFNTVCPIGEETIVLGCYDGRGIYILDVKDSRLSGIEEVTAAHEMLHAAYTRLSSKEKKYVNELIENELKRLTDERILKNIDSYRKKDPSSVINEAHSIFATEVLDLSPDLEAYYSRYFINRRTVVLLSESYESVFTNLKNQVIEYDRRLAELKAIIDSKEAELTKSSEEIIKWSADLEKLKIEGKISQYNSQVDDYNASVDRYRSGVSTLRSIIAEYNSIVEKRNQLANEQGELYQSIDSRIKDL